MAYKVIILYQLYMPSYFLGTFTEYPYELIQTYHKFGETENESLFFFSPLFPRKGIFIPSILSVHKPVVPNVSQ